MNIRVDLNYPIKDGIEVVFRSPVDCSQVTGLKVYYWGDDGNTASKEFVFADAHGNNVGDIDHLFAENVAVKVILDVTTGMAFVQNADTNAYIENTFAKKAELDKKAPAGYGLGERVGKSISDCNTAVENGWYSTFEGTKNCPKTQGLDLTFSSMFVESRWEKVHQTYWVATSGIFTHLHRYSMNNGETWTEWAWDDPPMIPDVEYRTTERRNGKAVYKKLGTDGVLRYRLDGETVWQDCTSELGAMNALSTDMRYYGENDTTEDGFNSWLDNTVLPSMQPNSFKNIWVKCGAIHKYLMMGTVHKNVDGWATIDLTEQATGLHYTKVKDRTWARTEPTDLIYASGDLMVTSFTTKANDASRFYVVEVLDYIAGVKDTIVVNIYAKDAGALGYDRAFAFFPYGVSGSAVVGKYYLKVTKLESGAVNFNLSGTIDPSIFRITGYAYGGTRNETFA